jgi:hypothetical protein
MNRFPRLLPATCCFCAGINLLLLDASKAHAQRTSTRPDVLIMSAAQPFQGSPLGYLGGSGFGGGGFGGGGFGGGGFGGSIGGGFSGGFGGAIGGGFNGFGGGGFGGALGIGGGGF